MNVPVTPLPYHATCCTRSRFSSLPTEPGSAAGWGIMATTGEGRNVSEISAMFLEVETGKEQASEKL